MKADGTIGAIMSLDVGQVRVGVAIRLAEGVAISGLGFFEREGGRAEREILALIKAHKVEVLVVGMPLDEQGTRTSQCEDVERFARRLERRSACRRVFVDEYASSAEALEGLRSGLPSGRVRASRATASRVTGSRVTGSRVTSRATGASRFERGLVDMESARILLDRFLRSEGILDDKPG